MTHVETRNTLNVTSLYYSLLQSHLSAPINFHPPWHTLSFISNALIKEPPYLRSCWVWPCEYSLTLSSASAAPHLQAVCVCLPHQSFSSFTCSPSLLGRQKQPTSTNFEIRLFDKNRALKSLARMLTAKKIQVPIGETACDQTDTAGKWLFVVPCPFW